MKTLICVFVIFLTGCGSCYYEREQPMIVVRAELMNDNKTVHYELETSGFNLIVIGNPRLFAVGDTVKIVRITP